MFGNSLAIRRLEKTLTTWWESYGDEHPKLQRFVIHVFSLTCNSYKCELN